MDAENYGMVCSQLTLQSDKRGFFLQFADSVIETAGPEWLAGFAQIESDRKKIQYCFSTPRVAEEIDTILSHIEPLNRSKSGWLSQVRRQDAQQALDKHNYQRALLLANQAVVRASKPGLEKEIDDGLSLPLALWLRSEILHNMDQHQRSLEDIQLALKYQLPSNYKNEAYLKMSECYYRMGFVDKAKVSLEVWKRLGGEISKIDQSFQTMIQDIEASKTKNEGKDSEQKNKSRIPRPVSANLNDNNNKGISVLSGKHKIHQGCSDMLEVRERPGAGREMIAAVPINVGTIVAREEPYSACLLTDKHGSHCLHCFSRLEVIVVCEECSGIAFCSNRCAALGAAYHRYECKHLDLLIGSGMSVLCFLALRMVTQNNIKYFKDIYTRLDDTNFHHPYAHIWRLEAHSDKRDAKSYLHRTLMAIFLVYVLRQTDYFGKQSFKTGTLAADELFIGELLLKHLQVLQYNAHEIYETYSKSKTSLKHTKTNYVGIAVYPSASLFNHDCQPTVARYFEGKAIVLRTVRPLSKGDVVAENYGPVYTMRTKEQRQKSLLARYLFRCVCQACQEDWPRIEDMTDDLPVYLRCDGRNCQKTFLYSSKSDGTPTTCRTCKGKTNLKEKYLLLSSLAKDFEIGISHMDSGDADLAQAILSAFVEEAFRIGRPPNRTLSLAQEALRCCWASKSNMIYIT